MNIGPNEAVSPKRLAFPCYNCGHNNVPTPKPVEAIKLFLTDKIPDCRQCGAKLSKRNFRFPESSVYMKRARRELGLSPEVPE